MRLVHWHGIPREACIHKTIGLVRTSSGSPYGRRIGRDKTSIGQRSVTSAPGALDSARRRLGSAWKAKGTCGAPHGTWPEHDLEVCGARTPEEERKRP